MQILLGYSNYKYPVDVRTRSEIWLSRLRTYGIQVDGFCLTLDPPGPRLRWRELEARWDRGDKKLLTMYENLARKLEHYDVFVNLNGINLHPDFVQQLPTFTIYGCFDDPESSDDLSRPVAWVYDLAMVGNIAALDMYISWGVKEVRFWPYGFRFDGYDPSLTREQILDGERDVDITLVCERKSPWRRERLDKFYDAFPQGAYYGKGWPNGFLPNNQLIRLYQRTKIGPNFHNSSGPINLRTYMLPANGVMQLCDNKSHLGKIFELNKEVVGFDTIEEAIDLCRFYLNHNDERRQIAAAGWSRALRDYNEVAVFKLMVGYIEQLRTAPEMPRRDLIIYIHSQRKRTTVLRVMYYLLHPLRLGYRMLRNVLNRVRRRLQPRHN